MNPTACILVIGNEILSGRTQDANIQFLARRLGGLGIALREVRIIPDLRETIVSNIVELRARFDHLLTTGGIGPTHDDITSPCVAEAFGVPWEIHPESFAKLEAHMAPGTFNAARQRMATLPRGAVPIENPVSVAPGFSIGNVHVMAGVPRIMQAMFDTLAPRLAGGRPVVSAAWRPARAGRGVMRTACWRARSRPDWRRSRIALPHSISAATRTSGTPPAPAPAAGSAWSARGSTPMRCAGQARRCGR